MKLSLPATFLVAGFLCGCASHRKDAAFKPVPGPSNPGAATAWDVVAAMPPAEVQPAPAAEEKPVPPPVMKDEPKKKSKPTKKPMEKIIVLPDSALSGKVVTFNSAGRFVVLHFPIGHMPTTDTVMSVYHRAAARRQHRGRPHGGRGAVG